MLQKYDNLSVASIVLSPSNGTKIFGGRGSAPDPAGGAHDAPPDPLVDWGGGRPPPQTPPPRRLRRLSFCPTSGYFLLPPESKVCIKPCRCLFWLAIGDSSSVEEIFSTVPRSYKNGLSHFR
jgi:hypothetical protein